MDGVFNIVCVYHYLFILLAIWELNKKLKIYYWFVHQLVFLFYDFQYFAINESNIVHNLL